MSVEEKLRNAMLGICGNVWAMVCPMDEPPEEYIVYNPEMDVPADFGDNKPNEWIQHMQVHYFVKGAAGTCGGDYTKKRKEIRSALMRAGFLISEITTIHEKKSGYNHLCFSCSIEEEMEE